MVNESESGNSKGGGILKTAKKAGVWIARPSFSEDNWNPGKGALDILQYSRISTKTAPLKYEDICKAYAHTLHERNAADIRRVKSRRNSILILIVIYSSLLIISFRNGSGIFLFPQMDAFIFGVPIVGLVGAFFILDFFLEVARSRRTIGWVEYVRIKAGLNGK